MSAPTTVRTHRVSAMMCALLVVASGCGKERETPPAERDSAIDAAPAVAEPRAPERPDEPSDESAVPPSEVSTPAAPACASFGDAVRTRMTYAAEHISSTGPRVPGGDFTFEMVGGDLRGEVQAEHGGIVRRHTLQSLLHDVTSDSIFFWYESGGGVRHLYRLHGSCDRLRGTARLFVTEDNTRGAVVRVELRPQPND